jgi:hypothetical protein
VKRLGNPKTYVDRRTRLRWILTEINLGVTELADVQGLLPPVLNLCVVLTADSLGRWTRAHCYSRKPRPIKDAPLLMNVPAPDISGRTKTSKQLAHVGSQAIFAGHKFRTVIHRWPALYNVKKNQNSYCMNRVTITNLVHLSCPSCGVRNTLFYSMKSEPPMNDIFLWPTGGSRGT